MSLEFSELKKKAEGLIEAGQESDRRILECRRFIQEYSGQVAEAQAELDAVSQPGENGKPRGDMARAQARLNVARNHLAAGRRALAAARQEGESIRQNKQAQAIGRYNQTARENLGKLRRLSGAAFGENARSMAHSVAERHNQLESARAALLRSIGIEAAADHISADQSGSLDWSGGGAGAVLRELTAQEARNQVEGLPRQAVGFEEWGPTLRLTPTQRWENGQRYIGQIMEIYRDNLRDLGVEDGPAMERALAEKRQFLLRELSRDIEGKENHLYDAPDYAALAERITRENQESSPYVISPDMREKLRADIRDGTVTEQDIRSIGRRVRERYDRLGAARQQEAEELRAAQFALAAACKRADTPEEREVLELQRRVLVERERFSRESAGRLAMARDALAAVRPVGPGKFSRGQSYLRCPTGSAPVIKALNGVREYLPSDWVERSDRKPISAKHVLRGYFAWGEKGDIVALSGLRGHMRSCAFHEMGHRFERLYPEILTIEKQFYDRRTAGESPRWLGLGYPPSEKTRFDQFTHAYMGKDYGGVGYEILSMGLEGVFCGKYNTDRDPEFQDLIFGILSVV